MALGIGSRARRMLLWALLAASAACALAYAGFIAAGEPAELSDAASLWVYKGALAFASLTCLVRAVLVRDQRVTWIAFGPVSYTHLTLPTTPYV